MSDQNKAIVRRYVQEVWSGGNFKVADELLDSSYVCYEPGQTAGPGDREATKASIQYYRSAFPDLGVKIDAAVAEGDWVSLRYTYSGTHSGSLGDMPASGNRITVPAASFFRLRSGKIAEEHDFYDLAGFMQQLKAQPEPARSMQH